MTNSEDEASEADPLVEEDIDTLGTDYFHTIDYSEINYYWGAFSLPVPYPWFMSVSRLIFFVMIVVVAIVAIAILDRPETVLD